MAERRSKGRKWKKDFFLKYVERKKERNMAEKVYEKKPVIKQNTEESFPV